VADLNLLPYSSQKRVYILKKTHTMTPAAQNALLKSLEDGPSHAVFLLLSNNLEAFLPTILSRAVAYKIPPVKQADVQEYLTKLGVSHETAQIASWFCQGGIGRALILATDEDFIDMRKMTIELAQNIPRMNIPDIFAAAKGLEQYKDSIYDILEILKLYYRDELIQTPANASLLLKNITAIDEAREKLERSCPFLLCMEVMLLEIS